jgi:DNA polymerase-3 subunit delta
MSEEVLVGRRNQGMRALQWLRDSSSIPSRRVYVVHGDDLYLRRQSLDAIIHHAIGDDSDDMVVSRFEGKAATLADVLDELRMLPFFSKQRVVIVEDADPFVTKHRKELEGHVGAPGGTGILVLVVKSWPSNTKLSKVVEGSGLAIDCTSPGEKDLLPWLTHLAETKHQALLEPDAARLLVELVGAEAGILAAEVEKLSVYAGESARIRREDVARLVEAGRIESVWKVLDAATVGDAASAVEHLDELLASGEYPIKVLAAFTSSLLKVYHAGRLRAARVPLEEACRIAGVFGVDKTRRQHAHLGPARVDRLPEMLARADLDLKGNSPLDPRVVLEGLLVELALPRKD